MLCCVMLCNATLREERETKVTGTVSPNICVRACVYVCVRLLVRPPW